MRAIYRPKFIIKIGENFFQINQHIHKMQNFISLHLKEKSMKFSKS